MDNINLKSNAPKNVINVTSDSTVYYANVAKEAANSASESAQLAAEKAQIVQNGAQTSLNAIEELKTTSLSAIETLADSSTSDINTLKTSSITEMTSAKTTALDSITQAKTGALASIESASANFSDKDLSNITDNGKNVIRTLASESGSSSGGGGGSWGSIAGTLSDQADLAAALAGKLDLDSTNSTKPYIVEFKNSGFYHYRKWSNGYLEQFGLGSIAENANLWINLPVSYSNNNYVCTLSAYYSNLIYGPEITDVEMAAYNVWINTKENDGFSLTNYGPYVKVGWYAFGKL